LKCDVSQAGSNVTLNLTSFRLDPGIHLKHLAVKSNDPDSRLVYIPFNISIIRADHDIKVVDIVTPSEFYVGESGNITVRIKNQGLRDEHNVTIQLFIDGEKIVNRTIIDFPNNTERDVFFNWTGEKSGIMLLEIRSIPLFGENITHNNVLYQEIIVIEKSDPWLTPTNIEGAVAKGDIFNSTIVIGNNGLAPYDYTMSKDSRFIFDDFPTISINESIWESWSGSPHINGNALNAPSNPYTMNLNGDGDTINTITINLAGLDTGWISFSYQLGGAGESPDSDDMLRLEIFDGSSQWEPIWTGHGTNRSSSRFNSIIIDLPAGAFHTQFRFRFVSEGSGDDYDDFFIDDVCFFASSTFASDDFAISNRSGRIEYLDQTIIDVNINTSKLNTGVNEFNLSIATRSDRERHYLIPIMILVLEPGHDVSIIDVRDSVIYVVQREIIYNVTIQNTGIFDEENIQVNLKINGTIVDNATVDQLDFANKTWVLLHWIPDSVGLSNISIDILPLQGENLTINNKYSTIIFIKPDPDIQVDPTIFNISLPAAEDLKINFTVSNTGIGISEWKLINVHDLEMFESFEDGYYDGWDIESGQFISNVTNSTAPNGGNKSVTMVGRTYGHGKGLTYSLIDCQPTYVSFSVRSGSTSHNDAFFLIGDDQTSTPATSMFYFYANEFGRFSTNNYNSFLYQSSQWYTIELVNIHWTAKTFDLYINGNLIGNAFSFRDSSIDAISKIHLYNLDDSQAWWDEIVIGYRDEVLPDWLYLPQSAGIIQQGFQTDIEIFLNASEASPGEYPIFLSLISNDPDSNKIEILINLSVNNAPIAQILQVHPDPAALNSSVIFNGTGIDSDGTIIAYRWYSSVDGDLSYNESFSSSHLSLGRHSIYFLVQDNHGIWSSQAYQSLYINRLPVATISVFPDYISLNSSHLNFSGFGTDDDGYITMHRWHSSIDGILNSESDFSTSLLSPGDHIISFSVLDNRGFWSENASKHLRIALQPVSHISMTPPLLFTEGEDINFTGEGSDADGFIIGYVWWASNSSHNMSENQNFIINNLTTGMHSIYLQVKDNDGVWSAPTSIEVYINARPIASIESEINFIPYGHLIIIEGSGFDKDGTVIGYRWQSDIDGILEPEMKLRTENLSSGNHTISFSVLDDFGAWSQPHMLTLYVSSAPVAVIEDINITYGNSLKPVVSFVGSGYGDGEIQNFSWKSDIDGLFGSTALLIFDNLSEGRHIISLSVQDEWGIWSPWLEYSIPIEITYLSEEDESESESRFGLVLLGLLGIILTVLPPLRLE